MLRITREDPEAEAAESIAAALDRAEARAREQIQAQGQAAWKEARVRAANILFDAYVVRYGYDEPSSMEGICLLEICRAIGGDAR